jgi:hypothetical protein
MPVSTPNRVANPVFLESYDPACILRHVEGMALPYVNITGSTIFGGEPVVLNQKVCICQKTILPGKEGIVISDWVVDAILDTANAAAILQNAQVWWSYDVSPIVAGMGGVVGTAPTNGFIFGRAVVTPGDWTLNGSGKPIAAAVGQKRIRISSIHAVVAAIGTIPTFN